MMIKKVRELTEAELDYAVAVAMGKTPDLADFHNAKYSMVQYSSDWRDGGAIIEKEEISINCIESDLWEGSKSEGDEVTRRITFSEVGATALIAAMRCFVVSKLGDEVEVPE